MSRTFDGLDESLNVLHHQRDVALADMQAPDRAARLAAVFEAEARLWSTYFDRTRSRCLWRAALGAEAWARHNAALWRARAAGGDRPVTVPAPQSRRADENAFFAAAGLDAASSSQDERAGM